MTTKGADIKQFLEFVYSFYKSINEFNIQLVYEGEITHQVTKAFTSLIETNMGIKQEAHNTQKKVFHVMVECLQNVGKHAEAIDVTQVRKDGRGVFLLCENDEDYIITTGNILRNTNISVITETLNKINSIDKDGLKQLYKQQMKEGRLSDKGGAGLGFIDIAKKTGNKLDYNFLPIDDDFSFFILASKITK